MHEHFKYLRDDLRQVDLQKAEKLNSTCLVINPVIPRNEITLLLLLERSVLLLRCSVES